MCDPDMSAGKYGRDGESKRELHTMVFSLKFERWMFVDKNGYANFIKFYTAIL